MSFSFSTQFDMAKHMSSNQKFESTQKAVVDNMTFGERPGLSRKMLWSCLRPGLFTPGSLSVQILSLQVISLLTAEIVLPNRFPPRPRPRPRPCPQT